MLIRLARQLVHLPPTGPDPLPPISTLIYLEGCSAPLGQVSRSLSRPPASSLGVILPQPQLPTAEVTARRRPRLRPRPPSTVPSAGNPLLRSKVTPASPSSDPRFPQLLSHELLPSFHFRAVPGPGASPLPVSGPPIPFPGNPCRLHTPHLHFRPPTFSLPRRPPSSKAHFRPPRPPPSSPRPARLTPIP